MRSAHKYAAWGIEYDCYDYRAVVGIGYSPDLNPRVADWSQPVTTLMFKTRREARWALANYKKKHSWTFTGKPTTQGGNRIYRSIHVVRLSINVSVVE